MRDSKSKVQGWRVTTSKYGASVWKWKPAFPKGRWEFVKNYSDDDQALARDLANAYILAQEHFAVTAPKRKEAT